MAEPQFKVCNKCGAICQSVINPCPGLVRERIEVKGWSKLFNFFLNLLRNKKKLTLEPCEGSDFRPLTIEELEGIKEGKTKVYFKEWPEEAWPTPKS